MKFHFNQRQEKLTLYTVLAREKLIQNGGPIIRFRECDQLSRQVLDLAKLGVILAEFTQFEPSLFQKLFDSQYLHTILFRFCRC